MIAPKNVLVATDFSAPSDAALLYGRGFARTVRTTDFTARFGRLDEDEGAMLTRPPRGFPADGPAAPWLRYKSFTATEAYTDAEATAADVADRAERTFRALLPMARWLNDALGHPRADRR